MKCLSESGSSAGPHGGIFWPSVLAVQCLAALVHSTVTDRVVPACVQESQHSLRTVTIVFCWGAFAWHSLTCVQLLTSQTCLLPCVVWVKRRDSVCHSTWHQPLLRICMRACVCFRQLS